MADSTQEICRTVKSFIVQEFFPGEVPEALKDDTALITGGILDSIGIAKLVIFLEKTHDVEFRSDETTADFIDTPASIARLISKKIAEKV